MNKNSIWIVGGAGRVGSRLADELGRDVENKVVSTDKDDVDITDYEAVRQACAGYRPTLIINCASLSDAAYCEANETEAYRVNTLGARNMAAVARQCNARIIYLSTDDVFCGDHNRPKNEFDVPTPETVYGRSKLAGENYTRELNPRHLIVRSSWVYGHGGVDYMAEVLGHAARGERFDAALNRVGTPTSIDALVQFILRLVDSTEYGIYHAADQGVATRHQFAAAILAAYGYDPALANAVMAGNGTAVVSTALDDLMMRMTGIHEMPAWQDDLAAYVAAHPITR